ncbi:MAG TPA: N-acetylmuramic acid 6-phosphate etherase [Devosia sp.]|nr:N-acetylmuramic acid 6-phosphate etherase [Devosia sp.]
MAIAQTEKTHVSARGFDLRPMPEALDILATAQMGAAWSVRSAFAGIARAAEAAADTISAGGNLVYAAAGSSALMAMADALELPGTYGIARERIKILIAGGMAGLAVTLAGASEDDELQAARDAADAGLTGGDLLIAVSASGTTPYALGAMAAARSRGARIVGMANNAGTPVLEGADIAICLPTPPEVIAGSTRMGAGTAQKIALNMLSTMMATRLGHVHDGYMVNVIADNLKLRERARRIVAAVAGVGEDDAAAALDTAGGSVKTAILLAAGADGLGTARTLLERAHDHLRPALAMLQGEARSAERSAS